jgi:pimeloyl-ACP methyl ester carboxylesterase
MRELAERFRVIRPDSRGHGRSTNPAAELSHARIADDIAAVIAALGLERPVVGSDGGPVTLELRARHPGAADAFIVGPLTRTSAPAGCETPTARCSGATERGSRIRRTSGTSSAGPRDETKALHPGGARAVAETGTRDRPDVARLTGAGAGAAPSDRGAGPDAGRRPRRAHRARPLRLALSGASDCRVPLERVARAAWRRLAARVLLAAPRSFPTFIRTGMNSALIHRADRHWYLETMGVAPPAQGLRIGTRLLAPVLEVD